MPSEQLKHTDGRLDCKVPLLTSVISGYGGTLTELNDFAQKLADMDSTSLEVEKKLIG